MNRSNLAVITLFACLGAAPGLLESTESKMPWREAGLSEQEAVAHLASRLTFGARPGDLDRIVEEGLEVWFERQLAGQSPEPSLDARLVELEPLFLSVEEITQRYPNPGVVVRQAMEAGVVASDFDPQPGGEGISAETRRRLMEFGRDQGYRPQRELIGTLLAQKVFRAVYAENQLQEVLTDFWFNHFNVSLTDDPTRNYVLAYERDAIRPFVAGSFRDMLGATARHPAMLLYLDNARSTAEIDDPTTMSARLADRGMSGRRRGRDRRRERPAQAGPQGLNENYARELLELHTLGVEGGYSQADVVEVARAFTGWSVLPPVMLRDDDMQRRVRRAVASGTGFIVENGFVFRADAHDAGRKTVLGHRLPSGRGIEDGEEVLDLVASHPSTARHLAHKLAVRFVSDSPPESLVDRLADVYSASDGQLDPVLRALIYAPEFWAAGRQADKIKSPFELAISALRAVDAEVENPRDVVEWIERMGQPLYRYQAPTGYPDEARFWVNSGALLNRMNYGLALAAGRVRGVEFDLVGLAGGWEPESRSEALRTYTRLLLPEREVEAMIELLEPMVMAPDLVDRIAAIAPEPEISGWMGEEDFSVPRHRRGLPRAEPRTTPPTAIEQVAGVILGSPEFQKR